MNVAIHKRKTLTLETVEEIADDFRAEFRRTPKEERPPCFSCPDDKIARCALTEAEAPFQCRTYRRYITYGEKMG